MIQLVILSTLLTSSLVTASTSLGCYSSIPSSYTSQGEYQYQTSSWCASECSQYSFFALTKGSTCYCGNEAPTGDTTDTCTTGCFGYGTEMCGGDDSYTVYAVADDYVASSGGNDASSSAAADDVTSSAEATTTTSSSTKTSSSATKTTSSSTGAHTTSAVSTNSDGGSTVVIYSTVAVSASTTAASTSSSSLSTSTSTSTSDSDDDDDSSSGGGSKAGIIGGVVGGVAGAAVIIGLAVFFVIWYRRRKEREERDAELADSAYFGAMKRDKSQLSRPLSNPFLGAKEEDMVDQRLNPVMLGRRRISEGSLADEADYSRKILRVANPDDN